MQCQFVAFLKDSLIFLLGDIKVYNIFRVLFWLSPHLTTWSGRKEKAGLPLWEVKEECLVLLYSLLF